MGSACYAGTAATAASSRSRSDFIPDPARSRRSVHIIFNASRVTASVPWELPRAPDLRTSAAPTSIEAFDRSWPGRLMATACRASNSSRRTK